VACGVELLLILMVEH
jgi:hypothetical protein